MTNLQPIILENRQFRLTLSADGYAESLILKETGAEMLYTADPQPFFTLTEERPYNNEIKLAHPHKRTSFGANRLRMEEGKLIVGFELIQFEAVVEVTITPQYMVFTLTDFLLRPDSFGLGVIPMLPPVAEFRMVQLPLAPRENFGEWLNVLWDDEAAVNVLSVCPWPRISSEKRRDYRILYGETLRDVQLKNAGVALIVSRPDRLLDAIDILEQDYDLPRGVQSRRSPHINHSYYWTGNIDPTNVDQHIAYAKKGGFRCMSIYYSAILYDNGYLKLGEYDRFLPSYPNGLEDLANMLKKIKDAGIIPGLHILQSHVGMRSRYITPKTDHRINLTRHFTLAKPLSADDTVIYVEENPEGSPVYEKTRILRFMGELIQYESYTTERPYCFTGCKRGFYDTEIRSHELGTIGGVLNISEFGANSAYVDQRTGLQDELAEGIAKIYDAGFEFLYYDGSEGTNPPFDINVGLAQWRVYRKLHNKPLFCEGAAKSHFSWHMLSGGNAFDAWGPHNFKEMIVEHPFKEAPRMANDFTRLNFGWWSHRDGQRPDIMEFGSALGAAWDCPGAFMSNLAMLENHPRTNDILETLRRWEYARDTGFITPEVKAELKKTNLEHTLLINESGELELAVWEHCKGAVGGDETVTVFLFERGGMTCAVCWNNKGDGQLAINLPGTVHYMDELGGEEISLEQSGDSVILPVGRKRYMSTDLTKEALEKAFIEAKLM